MDAQKNTDALVKMFSMLLRFTNTDKFILRSLFDINN